MSTKATWPLACIAAGIWACACGTVDDAATDGGTVLMEWPCELVDGEPAPASLDRIGCQADFEAFASEPLDSSIPGARSMKVVLDLADDGRLYFQNSVRYGVHYDFVSENVSGDGLPLVGSIADFNQTEYYSPDRRFVLGAVTHYEGPDAWALELSPYDTASSEMIEGIYRAVKEHAYFGPALVFHPTSQSVEARAADLPDDVAQITTDALFAAIDYQPLNLGTTVGRLRFVRAADLAAEYVGFRDVVVLDDVPNDISVVSGLITEAFQTPLSHVNVLSQNRGTPNMGLRGAMDNAQLRGLEGEWVQLTVGAFEWSIEQASLEEADAFWEANKPGEVRVPGYDTQLSGLHDIETLVVEQDGVSLRDAIKAAIPAFGGKASHFSILAQTPGVPTPKAFAIPVYYYDQFLRENGFDERLRAMLDDPEFLDDPAVRDAQLELLRDDMAVAPVNQALQDLLRAKLESEFPDTRMRYRSSTNAEDLDGFTGAGLYTSRTGAPDDWEDVLNALRDVWASVWYFRAFEERSYRSIDHLAVGMALLVHHSFPEEEVNGVALTGNPFDTSQLEPGFYVNAQLGEHSVVEPEPGVTTDQFINYYSMQGQPTVYLSHSSLVPEGESVLSRSQINDLANALEAIHTRFSPAYGPAAGNNGFYAMDVEFKFDGEPGEDPPLHIKQARPHPGRGQ